MTWRSAFDAVEFERQRATSGFVLPVGDCLGSVRDAYGSPGTGGSAASAFAATLSRHGVYDTPPLGALVWWTGGSAGFGHVGVSNGEGYFWTTDFGPNGYIGDGRIRLIPIAAINQHDPALKYVGWTSDLDGVEVLDMTDADKKWIASCFMTLLGAALWGLNPTGDPVGIPDSGSWKSAVAGDNIKAQADRIVAAVNAVQAQASSGNIDYAALAKAVNDDAAARLAQ